MRGLIGSQSIVSAQSVPYDYPAVGNWGGQQTVSSPLGSPYVYVSAPPGGMTYSGSDLVNLMNVSGKSNY
jgi:hypothetical protein